MDASPTMSLRHPFTWARHSDEDGDLVQATGLEMTSRDQKTIKRRRHSSYMPRRRALSSWGPFLEGEEGLLLRVLSSLHSQHVLRGLMLLTLLLGGSFPVRA